MRVAAIRGASLFVGGASQVTVRDNRITASPETALRRNGPAILIQRSSGVTLTDNTVSDLRPGTTAAIEIGSDVAPAEEGVSISGLNARLDPKSQSVIDRRTARSKP